MQKKLILILSLFLKISCQNSSPNISTSFGIQEEYKAFVPARIAVFPCKTWPQTLSPEQKTAAKLCKNFDQFILKSMKNQPFINGYTPKLVTKILQKKDKLHLLQTEIESWKSAPTSPIKLYKDNSANNIKWKKYLHELSKNINYIDAILLPFHLSSLTNNYPDRGMLVSEKKVHIILFLIDTNSGKLIWTQEKKAFSSQVNKPSVKNFSHWHSLSKQLFNEQLWRDFPGRIIY